MKYIEYSHRHAKAIIESDELLKKRYEELVGAISSITDEELISDFLRRKEEHAVKGSAFKSMTPSINGILKKRMNNISGWKSEVDIFNDKEGVIGNTEWRLDFACDNALCVEVAFNHGEAIAWNLLKPVLSCELNHVEKAVQGQIGIYVCATDKMKVAANIDSASGSYEKVLRYLPPMMNQLTIPMMIIGLEPFDTFKINDKAEIVKEDFVLDNILVNNRVKVTLRKDDSTYEGKVTDISEITIDGKNETKITIEKSKKNIQVYTREMIKFLELKEKQKNNK
ncbi:MAG: hypothetical protein K5656_08115 [Lachnospiraceae bacterium]|nr:hypothetical protein [Lachnospiraceae bacterium]